MAVNLTPEKKETPVKKPNYKAMRDKDREMVKGKFIFHEVPGGTMMFPIKIWKEDPVENYTFVDGEIYTIPLGVAKHLNSNCWYPQYGFVQTEQNTQGAHAPSLFGNGGQMMRVTKKVRRCSFQSLEFLDIDGLTPNDLVTVEKVA